MNTSIGWILCKPQFQDSYETKRLIEEFEKQEQDFAAWIRYLKNNTFWNIIIWTFEKFTSGSLYEKFTYGKFTYGTSLYEKFTYELEIWKTIHLHFHLKTRKTSILELYHMD